MCRSVPHWIIPSPPVNTGKMKHFFEWTHHAKGFDTFSSQKRALCMTLANCVFLTASCQPEELMTDITTVSVMLQHFPSVLFASSIYVSCSFYHLLLRSLPPSPPPSTPTFLPVSPLSPSSSFLRYSWKSWENECISFACGALVIPQD